MPRTVETEKSNAAVIAVKKYLSDGSWKKTKAVKQIIDEYGANYAAVLEEVKTGESDHGRWQCIPTDSTPSTAPDELPKIKQIRKPASKICPICGKSFMAERPQRKYCSEPCRRAAAKKKQQPQHIATSVA